MKNIYLHLLNVLVILSLTVSGCKFTAPDETPVPTGGTVTVSGSVVEKTTGDPISNVSIFISGGTISKSTSTDNTGNFSVTINLENDANLTVIASHSGYDNDTSSVFASVGSEINIPLIKLVQQEGTGGGSSGGQAASIYLFSQSAQSVGVKESGANESVQFLFEVLDSAGTPINSDNSVTVNFSMGYGPGGGEYLSPASVQSNALGRAAVTLNTGTVAGVTQIIASFTINNIVVTSRPVLVAIYGGFPDPNHFAVASDKLNYPELGVIGFPIQITAFCGDKYSNPVRPGTSVYFSTTSGIIGGSNITDELGRATVTLLTQPDPNLDEQDYGPGFFRIWASTIDENNNNIQSSTVRLLSGFCVISVNPDTIDIQNGGSQVYNFIVSDGNENPLSEGQKITVTVKQGDLDVSGDIDLTMLDTQSKNATMFTFTAVDSKPDTTNLKQAVIDIETSGPNGDKKISISGTSR